MVDLFSFFHNAYLSQNSSFTKLIYLLEVSVQRGQKVEIMKLHYQAGGVLLILLLVVCVEGALEFQITKDRKNQLYPTIYEDIVVWQDERSGNYDIYGYNLVTQREFLIITDPSEQGYPVIHGDIVVWVDERNGNLDIYGYNLARGREIEVTVQKSHQYYPAVYQDIVVWEDWRNGNLDIYGYNLVTEEEFQITSEPSDQEYPAIYENIVVWEDYRNGNKDIYGYNLTTKEEFQIITGKSHQKHPAIYRNIVVWADDKNGDLDIYGYDMITGQKILIVKQRGDQKHPAICEDIVVWEDWRNGYPDIYGFNLSSFFSVDNDGDGFSPPADCNDNNSGIHPGVKEICDGKDNDCNGLIDEGFDNDNDGYTTCGGDCDDSNSRTHPGAEEPCGKDYNCDGEVIPCTGTLKISVTCEGTGLKADVYINGEYKGETDAQGDLLISNLEAGTSYTVQVEQNGYTPREYTVEIEEGTLFLDFEMEKESSTHVLFFIPVIGILVVVLILKFRNPKKEKVTTVPAEEKRREKEEKPQKLTCPFCKNEIDKDWVSCPYCGTRLKDDTKVY